jgi:ABC-type bacteriocin/lantibiotic exporter with double-glycine peptidase domain
MTSFQKKIADKKESDKRLLSESFDTIYSLTNSKIAKTQCKDDFLNSIEGVLDYYGQKLPDIPDNITDREQLLLFVMSVTGVMRRKIALEGKWWKEATLPLLCTRSDGGITALIPRLTGSYARFDSQTGKPVLIRAQEASTLDKNAYCFYKPLKNGKMNTKDLLANIISVFSVGDIFLFLLISLFITLLGLLLPAINRYIFNDVIPSGNIADMWGVASLLIGAGTVSVLFAALRAEWALRIGKKSENYIENAVWARVLTLPVSFTKKYEAEDLTQRANAAGELSTILTGNLPPILLSLFFSVIYLFQIATYSSVLLWPSILILLLLLISILLTGYLSYTHYRDKRKLKTKLSSLTLQLYNGITKVKLTGAEVRSFNKWAKTYIDSVKEPTLFVIIAGAIYTFILFGGYILLYAISVNAGLDPSDYISFNVAYGTMTAAILQLGFVTGHAARIKPLLEQLKPILEAVPKQTLQKPT